MNIEMIQQADARAKGTVRVTPLLNAPLLDKIAGRPVYVKAECLQRTGSFKFRGAWSALSAMPPEARARGVLAYSSGNHAQAIALAAKMHGTEAVIIMPHDAPKVKADNTRAYGAQVVGYDRTGESREAIGAALAEERGLTLVRPYDDPHVIAGQGTCGLEIAHQAAEVALEEAAVITCCGGGGLTAGIALALDAQAPQMRVYPAEPEGFDDTARSLVAGTQVSNAPGGASICDAIVTPTPGDLTFPVIQRLCGPGRVVSDEDCLRAMALAFEHLRIVIEPGGAVALAAALFHNSDLEAPALIATASGGNVDRAMFERALRFVE